MGVDAEIYFKAKDGITPSDLELVSGFKICPIDKERYDNVEATHYVSSYVRYYSDGYERGPWPLICAVLMELIQSDEVEEVWYFGDNQELEEMTATTIADILYLSNHYMLHGHEPYTGYFKRA